MSEPGAGVAVRLTLCVGPITGVRCSVGGASQDVLARSKAAAVISTVRKMKPNSTRRLMIPPLLLPAETPHASPRGMGAILAHAPGAGNAPRALLDLHANPHYT